MAEPASVAILLSGRGSNMQALVEGAHGYRVVLVASDKPEAVGLAWAAARGLPTFALSPRGSARRLTRRRSMWRCTMRGRR